MFILIPIIILFHLNNNKKVVLIYAFSAGIYMWGYLSSNYAFGRIIAYLHILLFIDISLNYPLLFKSWRKNIFIFFILLFMLSNFVVITRFWVKIYEEQQYTLKLELQTLHNILQKDCICLTEESFTNYLPAFGCKVIYSVFPPYWILDNENRKNDHKILLNPDISLQTKMQLIDQYNINALMISPKTAKELSPMIDKIEFKEVYSNSLINFYMK